MPASSRILTKLSAESGVSVAGLKTTVLPQTSAGMIFHDGIAIGKFHGVMIGADAERLADRHRELVAQLRRHGLAVLAAPFAGHEEGHVDRFLDVAARFVEDLPHLARHVAGERLLALGDAAARRETAVSARRGAGTRRQCSYARRAASIARSTSARGRFLEDADQIVGVGRIAVLEDVARNRGHPRAVNKVVIGRHLRGRSRHELESAALRTPGCNPAEQRAEITAGLRVYRRWNPSGSAVETGDRTRRRRERNDAKFVGWTWHGS